MTINFCMVFRLVPG